MCLFLWEETGAPGENPRRYRVYMQTPFNTIQCTTVLHNKDTTVYSCLAKFDIKCIVHNRIALALLMNTHFNIRVI